jgi:hypothetical protein
MYAFPGFNYAYRRSATPATGTNAPPTASGTPAPQDRPAPAVAAAKAPMSGPGSARGTPAPRAPGTNGAASPAPPPPPPGTQKAKKDKQKEKKDKPDGAGQGGGSGGATPAPSDGAGLVPPALAAVADDGGLASPATDSAGARTPTGRRPPRNPWTLFVRMDGGVGEAALRAFFGSAAPGITRVNYPPSFLGKAQKIAYVEFGDEAAMQAGLAQHAEVRARSRCTSPRPPLTRHGAENRRRRPARAGRPGQGGACGCGRVPRPRPWTRTRWVRRARLRGGRPHTRDAPAWAQRSMSALGGVGDTPCLYPVNDLRVLSASPSTDLLPPLAMACVLAA